MKNSSFFNVIVVDDTAFSVETVHKTVLPINTLTFVEVFTKMNTNIGSSDQHFKRVLLLQTASSNLC